jgi:hypothetical protein
MLLYEDVWRRSNIKIKDRLEEALAYNRLEWKDVIFCNRPESYFEGSAEEPAWDPEKKEFEQYGIRRPLIFAKKNNAYYMIIGRYEPTYSYCCEVCNDYEARTGVINFYTEEINSRIIKKFINEISDLDI